MVKAQFDQIEMASPDEISRQAADALWRSMEGAMQALVPQIAERTAVVYARTFSEQELTDIDTFLESPAGRAWIARQPDVSSAVTEGLKALWPKLADEARRRFCLKVACIPPSASGAKGH